MAARVGSDKWLFFTTLLLIVVGLAMVFSASAVVAQERYHSEFAYVGRQAGWALAGVMAMLVLMNIDSSFYNSPKVIFPLLAVTTLLLVLVFLFQDSHNTHRWIRFGGLFTFQPSEIAKPVLVLFLAWFLATRLDAMRNWKRTILPAIVMPLVFMLLIVKQPDLGTALVLFGVTAMMLWLAGIDWKWLVGGVAAALPIVAGLLFFVAWRRARMLAFLNPPCDAKSAGAASYHICQSLIAVGTGGLIGRGYMESMQKLFYLPEASTDFIFSIIGEELGFIGAFLIVLLFAFLGMRGFRAAFRTKDSFSRLAAFGITTTILLLAFFNISVVLSLVPTKGIPLPLISSGGTSLFCTLASIGVLLNISRKADGT
jgi:cell division protein FtsW